ncbi:MAG: hypothetical protein AAGJ50_01450 [Pseudomonadota bacterium]
MVLNWEVFTRLSPPEIQIHWATATLAFALGLVIFLRPKGTLPHKTLGVFYASLMTVTSASAFFIRSGDVSGWAYLSLAGMSWIHLFIPITMFGVVGGLYGILVLKNKRAHRGPLIGSFVGGLVIAGAFTFLPGRRMHAFFFADAETIQMWISSIG